MESKKFYLSKTVILNFVLFIIAVSGIMASFFSNGTVDPSSIALLVGSIAGAVLRVWFTDSAISH
jgi:hypothetical protein